MASSSGRRCWGELRRRSYTGVARGHAVPLSRRIPEPHSLATPQQPIGPTLAPDDAATIPRCRHAMHARVSPPDVMW